MGREDPQLKLRLTEQLKASVTEEAKLHNRSVNSEIVARLEEYPKLRRLQMDVSYFKMENERLTTELTEAKAEAEKQSVLAAQLKHLLDEGFRKAEQDEETIGVIEKNTMSLKNKQTFLKN